MLNKKLIAGLLAVVILFLGIYSFALPRNDDEKDNNPGTADEADNDNKNNNEDQPVIGDDTDNGTDVVTPINNRGNRPMVVADTTAPIITLNGDSEIIIDLGGTYTELGATVTDNKDTDLVAIASGDVDTATAGIYIITYKATDTDGNVAVKTRTVIVRPVIQLTESDKNNFDPSDETGMTLLAEVDEEFVAPLASVLLGSDIDDDDVSIEGTINPSIPGTYTLTYTYSKNGLTAKPLVLNVKVQDTTPARVNVTYISNKDKDIEYNKLGDRVAIRFRTNEEINLSKTTVTIAGDTATKESGPVRFGNEFEYVYSIKVGNETDEGQVEFVINVTDLYNNATPAITLNEKSYTSPRIYTGKIIIDKTAPILNAGITFNPYYVQTVARTANTTVHVEDLMSGINRSTLKYVWSANSGSAEQLDSSFTNSLILDGNGNAVVNTNGLNPQPTGTYYLWIMGYDNAGNKFKVHSREFVLDNEKPGIPEVTMKVGNNDYNQNWTNGDVVITLLAVDHWFTIGGYQYSINGGDWTNTTNTITYNTDTNISVRFRAIDSVGNIGNATGSYTIKIDKGTPVLNNDITFTPDRVTTLSKIASTIVHIEDLMSGINQSTLRYVWSSNGGSTEQLDKSFTSTFTLDNNGNSAIDTTSLSPQPHGNVYLWVMGYDNAGNKFKVHSREFVLDNEKPTVPNVILKVDNVNYDQNWTNGDVIVTLNATDGWFTNRGINYQYSINDGTWLDTPSAITYNTNTNISIRFRAIDSVGNIGNATGSYTIKIDKTAPILNAGISFNPYYVQQAAKTASTTVYVEDLMSGINRSTLRYVWSANSGSTEQLDSSFTTPLVLNENGNAVVNTNGLNPQPTGTYYLWVMGYDNAGNKFKVQSREFVLDNTAPYATNISYSDVVDGELTATLELSEPVNDITDWSKINSKKFTKSYDQDGTYLVSFTDLAGNGGSANINIDTTAPEIGLVSIITNGNRSNNTYYAKLDQTVTLTFTVEDANEVNLSDIAVTIAGQTANVSKLASPANTYQAVITVGNIATEGLVSFSINASDGYDNAATPVTSDRADVTNAYVDKTAPSIQITGDTSLNIEKGSTYTDQGATANDAISGINGVIDTTITFNSNTTPLTSIDTSVVGTYYIHYNVSDNAGNPAVEQVRTVNVIAPTDTTGPTVAFEYQETGRHKTKTAMNYVTVTDLSNIDNSSLKYLWTFEGDKANIEQYWLGKFNPSTNQPYFTPFTVTTQGKSNSIPTQPGSTYLFGQWHENHYLWIYAKDTLGNPTLIRSDYVY